MLTEVIRRPAGIRYPTHRGPPLDRTGRQHRKEGTVIAADPLLDTYVQAIRAALAAGEALEPMLQRIADAMRPLLADRRWLAARDLPLSGEPRYYLLYEDPDQG